MINDTKIGMTIKPTTFKHKIFKCSNEKYHSEMYGLAKWMWQAGFLPTVHRDPGTSDRGKIDLVSPSLCNRNKGVPATSTVGIAAAELEKEEDMSFAGLAFVESAFTTGFFDGIPSMKVVKAVCEEDANLRDLTPLTTLTSPTSATTGTEVEELEKGSSLCKIGVA